MRTSGDTLLVTSEPGTPCGITLTGDYCSEHEHGIKGLKRAAGIMPKEDADKKKVWDFQRITVHLKNPDDVLVYHDDKDMTILAIDPSFGLFQANPQWFEHHKIKPDTPKAKAWCMATPEWRIPEKLKKGEDPKKTWKKQTLSAWDEDSFGVSSRDPQVRQFLRDLKEALLGGDAVIHLGGPSNPFGTAGLTIGIASRVPQGAKDSFREAHEDRHRLNEAVVKTGIVKKLAAAGKHYYALSPRWTKEGPVEPAKTQHPVTFWLNPMDQHLHNSMWATVEDLEAWAEGKGPIPKAKAR